MIVAELNNLEVRTGRSFANTKALKTWDAFTKEIKHLPKTVNCDKGILLGAAIAAGANKEFVKHLLSKGYCINGNTVEGIATRGLHDLLVQLLPTVEVDRMNWIGMLNHAIKTQDRRLITILLPHRTKYDFGKYINEEDLLKTNNPQFIVEVDESFPYIPWSSCSYR
jgi:hypothetical protein